VSQQTNWVPTSVDLEKPSAARIYDYVLGGNHNFAVDRAFIKQRDKVDPNARQFALQNRAYLRRVVLYLMEQGVRQFLDLGSGIPTVGNVHEIAQAADPSTRVVYVEIEHVAVAHSQLILEDNPNAVMVHADVTTPGLVLGDPATRATLDFDKPIGVLAVAIGHYILDDPESVFAAYRNAVAPGSYLGLSHLTDDFRDMTALTEDMARTQNAVRARTKDEISRLFGDWELVEPGLVTTSQWRPDRDTDAGEAAEQRDGLYAGVARKR
jgi:SAM-dependent methyltransferase